MVMKQLSEDYHILCEGENQDVINKMSRNYCCFLIPHAQIFYGSTRQNQCDEYAFQGVAAGSHVWSAPAYSSVARNLSQACAIYMAERAVVNTLAETLKQ